MVGTRFREPNLDTTPAVNGSTKSIRPARAGSSGTAAPPPPLFTISLARRRPGRRGCYRTGQRKGAPSPPAATPPPPERSDPDRIVWLLAFLRRDVAALGPGELLALRDDVFPYLHDADQATVTVIRWNPPTET